MRKRLRQERLKRGLSQQKVGEILGLSLSQYHYIETGKALGKVTMWDTLEDFFGIPQRLLREDFPDEEE